MKQRYRRYKLKRTLSADSTRENFWRRIDWMLLILVTICSGVSVLMLRTLWTENISTEVDANDWIVQLISLGLGLAGCIIVSAIDYHKLARFWFLYAPIALGLVALTFTNLGYGREGADDRAWIDLEAVCDVFPDWHPIHDIDLGEMAAAVAIGYDWMYESENYAWMNQEGIKTIKQALKVDAGGYKGILQWQQRIDKKRLEEMGK